MQKAEKRFKAIVLKYKNLGIAERDFVKLDVKQQLFPDNKLWNFFTLKKVCLVFSIILALILASHINIFDTSNCLFEMPDDASKWFRQPESCDICENVSEVPKIRNITPEDFNKNFAIPAKPVVISDGAIDWSASKLFSFNFFKQIYSTDPDSGDSDKTCQFFPYKTEFKSLQEALSMDQKRADLDRGQKPWYIGWSNCNDRAGKILRQHYRVPYFLPNTSENMALNWIFMGGPGYGAHMHVDNVQYPSWQAQLKGKKMWRLAPPPECYYKCREMRVVVEPGEIIVVDTNRWYHQTLVLPGEISITIGSEFD